VSNRIELDLDVFEMRFVIGSCVKSDDLHQPGCKRIAREKQGDETLFQSFNAFKSFRTFRPGAERRQTAERKNMRKRAALSLLYCGAENSL
jgi:hypothetical protein